MSLRHVKLGSLNDKIEAKSKKKVVKKKIVKKRK